MKLNTNTHQVTGSGFDAVSEFGVSINAKTFKVLSDTIYKDKIGSIVRELSCNAYDSHTVAGKSDVPFEIHLPDNFEPYFSIRDFGTGISPEDIKTVYCQYFESTKDQSNDEVGAFGLGSKTPFSYTDAFTVISIHKGVKRMYNAHVNAGLPSIVSYGEPEPTDEPDGLEVNVGIETLDYKAFGEAVKRQLKFFPVKPTILNGSIEWSDITPTLQVAGFTFYKIENARSAYYGSRSEMSGLFLKQGPVGYPVDFDVIDQYLNSKGVDRSPFYKYIQETANRRDSGVIIDMPIGTVEVTASREGISYSDVTIRNMLTKFDAIASEVFKDVKKTLDTSYAEGNAKFAKTVAGLDGYFLSSLTKETMEKNYPNFSFHTTHGGFNTSLKLDTKFIGTAVQHYEVSAFSKPKASSRYLIKADETLGIPLLNMSLLKDDFVYIKDIKTNFIGRIKDDCDHSRCVVLELPTGASVADLKKVLGDGVNLILLSSLPAPQIKRTNTSGGHSITGGKVRAWFKISNLNTAYMKDTFFDGVNTLYRLNFLQVFAESFEEAVKDNVNYVYVLTHNNKVIRASTGIKDYPSDEVSSFVTWLENAGYEVIAIPEKMESKAANHPQFSSFKDMWNDRASTFYAGLVEEIKTWALYNYYGKFYNGVYTKEYRWSNDVMMDDCLEILKAVNVNTSSVEDLLTPSILDESNNVKASMINHAVINSLIDKHSSDNVVKLALTDLRSANSDVYAYENAMERLGIDIDVKLSEVIEKFTSLLLDNIDKIVLQLVSTNESGRINHIEVADPFTSEKFYLSFESIKNKLVENLSKKA